MLKKNSLIAQTISDLGRILIVGGLVLGWIACEPKPSSSTESESTADVVLHTDAGEIHIRLFDETPIHKANFLHLAQKGFFDSLSFNRIISRFVIQSGDPRYRNGQIHRDRPSGPGYELAPEFVESLVHTRGRIGAARAPNEVNPEMLSSGSQFYIVIGEPADKATLDTLEGLRTTMRRGPMLQDYLQARAAGEFTADFNSYLAQHQFKPFRYPASTRARYLEIGGAPNLDFTYTVFGEVIAGMEVALDISTTPTYAGGVPQDTMRILRAEVRCAVPPLPADALIPDTSDS